MQIKKIINKDIDETEVTISANNNIDIDKIVYAINNIDKTILCTYEGELFRIKWKDVFYFESVDKKTFVYTQNKVFGINKKLYEIEDEMTDVFARCSKSYIINLSKVNCFKLSFESRMEAVLINDEKVIINRHYVESIKKKLYGGEQK